MYWVISAGRWKIGVEEGLGDVVLEAAALLDEDVEVGNSGGMIISSDEALGFAVGLSKGRACQPQDGQLRYGVGDRGHCASRGKSQPGKALRYETIEASATGQRFGVDESLFSDLSIFVPHSTLLRPLPWSIIASPLRASECVESRPRKASAHFCRRLNSHVDTDAMISISIEAGQTETHKSKDKNPYDNANQQGSNVSLQTKMWLRGKKTASCHARTIEKALATGGSVLAVQTEVGDPCAIEMMTHWTCVCWFSGYETACRTSSRS